MRLPMKSLLKLLASVAFLFAAYMLGSSLVNTWLTAKQVKFEKCTESGKTHARPTSPALASDFNKCLTSQAKVFLDRDYTDFKDFGKAFLTLLSATLVASITFSEKIVDISKAELFPLSTMIACWVLLLLAIISLLFGLTFMAHAAWTATYDPDVNFLKSENNGVRCLFMSVGAFVCALLALVTAGVVSLFQRRAANPK